MNQPSEGVGLARPVVAAVPDARVQVQSIGDFPGVSVPTDAADLGIDSSGEKKGSSLFDVSTDK